MKRKTKKQSRPSKPKPAPKPKEELYSVNALSRITGRDRRTLDKSLVDVEPASSAGGRKRYRLRDVEAALDARGGGDELADLRAEQIRQQTRETQARADLLEMERKKLARELVPLSEVAALVNPILLAVRQRLNAMPSELSVLVNPTDPQHAQQQATAWVERTLPLIRQSLPEPKAET